MKNLFGFERIALSMFLSAAVLFGTQAAQAGGGGTGGGNSLGSTSVSPDEIKELIKESKYRVLFILRQLELNLVYLHKDETEQNSLKMLALGKKLFHGEKTIYESLKEAEVDHILDQSCFDNGREVEASVGNFPQLCFNLKRLARKLNNDSVEREVLAMMVHELSHTVRVKLTDKEGATEEEAVMLQTMVKNNLTNSPFERIPELVGDYKIRVNTIESSVFWLFVEASSQSSQKMCMYVTSMSSAIDRFLKENLNSSRTNGIIFSAPNELGLLQAAQYKLINIFNLCGPQFSKLFRNIFNGKDKIRLIDFEKGLDNDQRIIPALIPIPNIFIRNIGPKNIKNLNLELNDIKTLLHDALRKT